MLENNRSFFRRHIGNSEQEQKKMLDKLGYMNIKDLKSNTVPANIHFKEPLIIGEPNSEYEALRKLKNISKQNKIYSNFIGMGYYGTYIPNVILRNTIVHNNVYILDGCVIGKKGFGFFPDKKLNYRYPQIGVVIINDNAEIGCGATIDRGSMSNTIIGKNTYPVSYTHLTLPTKA